MKKQVLISKKKKGTMKKGYGNLKMNCLWMNMRNRSNLLQRKNHDLNGDI